MVAMSIGQRLAAAIGAFAEAVARCIAPATPWLFLALRRAWIPTAFGLVAAMLFFVVPQSREVLHGLSEPVLRSFTDFDPKDADSVNVWALLSYLATAVLLALALWYAARLLSTVEAGLGTPQALLEGRGEDGLRRAATWYPRGLGVAVLAAAAGALIYANYTPQLSQAQALLLVAVALAGPMLLAIADLVSRPRGRAALAVTLLLVGAVLLMAVAVWLLWQQHAKWPMRAWSIGSATTPALLLTFLARRRQLLQRFGWSDGKGATSVRSFGEVIVRVSTLVLLSGLALLLLALLPPGVMRAYGSAAAILMFLAVAALLLTGVQLFLRRVSRDVPGIAVAVFAMAALLVALVGNEDLGTEVLDEQPKALLLQTKPATAPAAAAAAASAATPPRTLYVNAYGGGLRAAVFTAQVLARADDATCGKFGERIAAFSGVSGGSVGIATYLVARQEGVARGLWQGCAQTAGEPVARTPLTDIVTGALVQDHLSSVIGRLVAVDAPHFYGAPQRGQALLSSLNSALVTSLAGQFKAAAPAEFAAFALPLARLTGGLPQAPSVYFNATDADSGHITWFSNDHGGSAGTYARPVQQVAVSVGQAVLHSARFPLVTPAGAFPSPWEPQTTRRLVDGGYVDNSGTTTLLELALGANPPHGESTQFQLIDIDGNPDKNSKCSRQQGKPPVLTSVRALLSARSAHAARAVERFEAAQRRGGIEHLVALRLDLEAAFEGSAVPGEVCEKVSRAEQAPLGWYMSYGAASTVAKSAQLEVQKMCDSLRLPCQSRAPPVVTAN